MNNKLLKRQDIIEELRLINDTDSYYISNLGNVYSKKANNLFLKMKFSKGYQGYYHISMVDKAGNAITKRVNRLVANHFIPNPQNLPFVGHKNNIKTDNRVENLYWTTPLENTRKAIKDGLIKKQPSDYMDSQSFHVIVYDKNMNEIDRIGSLRLCSKKYKVSVSTISRHCNGEIHGKTRCGYYFRYEDK